MKNRQYSNFLLQFCEKRLPSQTPIYFYSRAIYRRRFTPFSLLVSSSRLSRSRHNPYYAVYRSPSPAFGAAIDRSDEKG